MCIIYFFFFFPFRSEKVLLGGHFPTYQGKLAEPGVLEIIDNNRQKLEPYAAMVDRSYENLNSEFVDNQDAHGQIENDETGQSTYSEDTERTEQSSQIHGSHLAPGEFMPRIPNDEKIAASIRTLNKKQCMVFDVLHQWARNYV